MEKIRLYTTSWCPDCWYAKNFLKDRGIAFDEVNVDEDPDAEDLILRVNNGLRKVPTVQFGDRYFGLSPFDPERLAEELKIPLNP